MLSEKTIQGGTILPGEPLPTGEIMERLFQQVRKKLSFNILSVGNRQSLGVLLLQSMQSVHIRW